MWIYSRRGEFPESKIHSFTNKEKIPPIDGLSDVRKNRRKLLVDCRSAVAVCKRQMVLQQCDEKRFGLRVGLSLTVD